MDLAAAIRAAVRAERHRLGLRQADLAERLGWERSAVSHVETGARPVRVTDLPKLCAALDISLARLFMDADPDDLADMRL